jgi:hypothetical protein
MKTAVEWLVNQMKQRESQGLTLSMYELEMFAEQAKEMDKEQIGKAFLNGRIKEIGQGVLFDLHPLTETFNDYYNETFKSE